MLHWNLERIQHTMLNRSTSQIRYFSMKILCILIPLVVLVSTEDSEEREGRQFQQGFPSMGTPSMATPTLGGTNSSPFSGMNLPSLPNFGSMGLSSSQVPSSLQSMQPGSDNFNNMFQKMFSGVMNTGGNPMSSMMGGMGGGLPNMASMMGSMGGGLPSMGGGLPSMGGGFPGMGGMGGGFPGMGGMGGGFPDMMGGGDMFGGMFGSPTTVPTTTTTTTTTTTAAPQMDPFGMPFGGGMGLTMPFGGSMPGFGSGGLPGFGNGMPNFNTLPSMPGLPQLSNPGNNSLGFENFASAVPMFGGFNQNLGRSADEDVAKLKDITFRLILAFKIAKKEANLTCQIMEICHGIKEALDHGVVGSSSSKPICVAGCKMLSTANKMNFEPCFKTCVQSEMKEDCEVLFPGCERNSSHWVSLSNESRDQVKAAEKLQENLISKNSLSQNQGHDHAKHSEKSQNTSDNENFKNETDM